MPLKALSKQIDRLGAGLRSSRRAAAYTLLEVLLTMSLFIMLISVLVFTTWGIRAEFLDQGAYRFETVIRLARTEAANRGRRMRLQFQTSDEAQSGDAELPGSFSILWEPQPLAEPGQFVPYTDSSWARSLPNEMITVVRSQLTGASAHQVLTYDQGAPVGQDAEGRELQSVNFYPDGSSDSAFIELQSRDTEDTRHALISLDGINGIIETSIMTQTELQEFYEDSQMSSPSGATGGTGGGSY